MALQCLLLNKMVPEPFFMIMDYLRYRLRAPGIQEPDGDSGILFVIQDIHPPFEYRDLYFYVIGKKERTFI